MAGRDVLPKEDAEIVGFWPDPAGPSLQVLDVLMLLGASPALCRFVNVEFSGGCSPWVGVERGHLPYLVTEDRQD